MSSEQITVPLPSLIHRIGGDNTQIARTVAEQLDCRLKRVRRSRNWQVTGSLDALTLLHRQLKSESYDDFRFVYQKIATHIHQLELTLEPQSERLKRLVLENPTITLAELMAMTDCSLVEARLAREHIDL